MFFLEMISFYDIMKVKVGNSMKVKFKLIFKIIGIIIVSISLFYVMFIVEESIRLSNGGVKPLIVLEEKYINDDIIYKSLGFSIIYRCYNKSSDLVLCGGQEFWLFDKFLIWSWIS